MAQMADCIEELVGRDVYGHCDFSESSHFQVLAVDSDLQMVKLSFWIGQTHRSMWVHVSHVVIYDPDDE
jgi:hypothetical protein